MGKTGNPDIDEFFGPVYTEFQGKGSEAEAHLRETCECVAKGALSYPGIAPIDLVWGDSKAGYMKIVVKQPEVVGRLQELLNECSITNQSDNRIVLESDTHKMIVSKKKGATPTDNWLLTAYEKKEKSVSASSSDIETEPIGKRNGTATPQNGLDSDGKINTLPTEKQGEGEKSSLGERVAAASADVNTEPTEAQKKAGNYKKGHVKVGTFDVTIEQPVGSIRRGKDANGNEWATLMMHTYGYIRGTEGVDGDHIDVFLSSDIDGWNVRKAFVVDQYNPDGSFDEHKVMLGFNDKDEAFAAYLANYEKGWENGRRLDCTEVNMEDFEKWIESSHRKTKPFADYKGVKDADTELEKLRVGALSVPGYTVFELKEDENGRYGNKRSTTRVYFDRDGQYAEQEIADPMRFLKEDEAKHDENVRLSKVKSASDFMEWLKSTGNFNPERGLAGYDIKEWISQAKEALVREECRTARPDAR